MRGILDHLFGDLPVGQQEIEHFMLPQLKKRFSGHLGQRHEAPVRQEHAFARQNVDVRMPMDQISESLDRPNHSGHTVGASAHRFVNRAERPAGRLAKLPQQRAIIAEVAKISGSTSVLR